PSEIDGLADRPEAANLVGIYAALSCKTDEEVLREFGGAGFGVFKPALADIVVDKIAPIGAEMRRLESDPAYLRSVLVAGAEKAGAVADKTIRDVKEIVGFVV
ncbi:MAG TPA: tryptophan--tRNA ligase, partial [Parvularculaceae bacterium]|nr:tryptophan--tRNA ligase [Parvularculaceae bacterium]